MVFVKQLPKVRHIFWSYIYSSFFRVQVFKSPGFSGSGSRIWVWVQVQGPGSWSRVRVQVLDVANHNDMEKHLSLYFFPFYEKDQNIKRQYY